MRKNSFEQTRDGDNQKTKASQTGHDFLRSYWQDMHDKPGESAGDHHAEHLNKTDRIRVRNAQERYKKLIEAAPTKDVKELLMGDDMGPRIKAMLLGIKPVLFDGNSNVSDYFLDTEKGYDLDRSNQLEYVKHVKLLYKQTIDHITSEDHDLRAINLSYRVDDPEYIDQDDGSMIVPERKHALYSLSLVREKYRAYPSIFHNRNNSESSINEHITSLLGNDETHRNNIMEFGLLCGFPQKAVEAYVHKQVMDRSVEIPGMEYETTSSDKESILFENKVHALFNEFE
ncbi:hypothetical protein ccbrp13_51880 [Ktedonobacteria bacterium brp13]|nr:hypothetical protein ccbrp13_51880 [Ktedonobacteria bacterium brp13]